LDFDKLKKYYNDNKLIFHCAIIAILFFVNCFVEDFSYLIFTIVGIMIVFLNIGEGFSLLVFCIPFCCLDEYTSVLMFFVVFLVFIIKSYYVYLKIDRKKISLPFLIGVGAFLIYSLLPIGEYSIGLWVKLLIILLLVFFLNLYLNYRKEMSIKNNLGILAISLFISAAFYLTYFISPYMQSKTIWYHGEDYIRFTCLLVNPNTLAMLCEICLSLLTYFILSNRFTWVDVISYVIFAVLGISTLSKTFLILFVLMVIILLLYLLRRFKTEILWIVGLICFGLVALIIFKSDFLYTYLERFMSADPSELTYKEILNVITTGRYDLWIGVLDYLFMNPTVLIFGRGLGAPLVESMSAHNFYISLIYEVGLIGTILFFGMFLTIIIYYMKRNKTKFNYAILAPLIIVGMLMMVEDLFLYIY